MTYLKAPKQTEEKLAILRDAYENSARTLGEIAGEHGLASPTYLSNYAAFYGWKRRNNYPRRVAQKAATVSTVSTVTPDNSVRLNASSAFEAFKNGEDIEFRRSVEARWFPVVAGTFELSSFAILSSFDFRIRPEPHPFSWAVDCLSPGAVLVSHSAKTTLRCGASGVAIESATGALPYAALKADDWELL